MPLAKPRIRWMPRSPTFASLSDFAPDRSGNRVGSNSLPLSSMWATTISSLRSNCTVISRRSSVPQLPYIMTLATASSIQSWIANEVSPDSSCWDSIHPASRFNSARSLPNFKRFASKFDIAVHPPQGHNRSVARRPLFLDCARNWTPWSVDDTVIVLSVDDKSFLDLAFVSGCAVTAKQKLHDVSWHRIRLSVSPDQI